MSDKYYISNAEVIDGRHGIEVINADKTYFYPWFYSVTQQACFYYSTKGRNYRYVKFETWREAFDYIAKQRHMLTSDMVASSYVREAKNSGFLPADQAQPDERSRDPWFHPNTYLRGFEEPLDFED